MIFNIIQDITYHSLPASTFSFSRGKPFQEYPGNVRFRKIVDSYKDIFSKSLRYEKLAIATKVIKEVQQEGSSNGGRFIKKAKDGNYWVEVTDKTVRLKVSHCLREPKSTNHTLSQKKRRFDDLQRSQASISTLRTEAEKIDGTNTKRMALCRPTPAPKKIQKYKDLLTCLEPSSKKSKMTIPNSSSSSSLCPAQPPIRTYSPSFEEKSIIPQHSSATFLVQPATSSTTAAVLVARREQALKLLLDTEKDLQNFQMLSFAWAFKSAAFNPVS